jgi:hypothetical protein
LSWRFQSTRAAQATRLDSGALGGVSLLHVAVKGEALQRATAGALAEVDVDLARRAQLVAEGGEHRGQERGLSASNDDGGSRTSVCTAEVDGGAGYGAQNDADRRVL